MDKIMAYLVKQGEVMKLRAYLDQVVVTERSSALLMAYDLLECIDALIELNPLLGLRELGLTIANAYNNYTGDWLLPELSLAFADHIEKNDMSVLFGEEEHVHAGMTILLLALACPSSENTLTRQMLTSYWVKLCKGAGVVTNDSLDDTQKIREAIFDTAWCAGYHALYGSDADTPETIIDSVWKLKPPRPGAVNETLHNTPTSTLPDMGDF